jgi:hypothetical protein
MAMRLLIPDRERGGYRYRVTPAERWPSGSTYVTPNSIGHHTPSQLEEMRERDYAEWLEWRATVAERQTADSEGGRRTVR